MLEGQLPRFGFSISRADVADCLIKALENFGVHWKIFGVSNGPACLQPVSSVSDSPDSKGMNTLRLKVTDLEELFGHFRTWNAPCATIPTLTAASELINGRC